MWRAKPHWLEPQLNKLVFNDPSFTVLSLNGHHDLTKEDIVRISQALDGNTKLKELNLRGSNIDMEATRKIKEVLEGSTGIQYLNLNMNSIGSGGASMLADALRVNKTLTSLQIMGNAIDQHGAAALGLSLKSNRSLLQLCLSNNEIRDDGLRFITEALAHEAPLQDLDVHACSLGCEGVTRLAETLKENSTLTKLDLNANKILDDGANALASMLQQNNTLVDLDLGSAEMGNLAAEYLAQGLADNRALTSLRLSCNLIGNNGVKKFAQVVGSSNKTIREITLECNPIDTSSLSHMEDLLELNLALHEKRPPRKQIVLPVSTGAEQGPRGINDVRLSQHPKDAMNSVKSIAASQAANDVARLENTSDSSAAQENADERSKPRDKLVSEVLADLGIGVACPASGGGLPASAAAKAPIVGNGRPQEGTILPAGRDDLIDDMLAELGGNGGKTGRRSGYPRRKAA